jgi:hypothetical protein
MEHMANFKHPTTGLGGLQVALTDLEMLLPERGSEMAGLGQKRITDGNPIGILSAFTRQR